MPTHLTARTTHPIGRSSRQRTSPVRPKGMYRVCPRMPSFPDGAPRRADVAGKDRSYGVSRGPRGSVSFPRAAVILDTHSRTRPPRVPVSVRSSVRSRSRHYR